MEVSILSPLKTEEVGGSFIEDVQTEFLKEKDEGVFYRNLSESVQPSVQPSSCKSEEKSAVQDIEPSPSLSNSSSEERPLKTSVERLAEMISFPCHSSSLDRGVAPRELLQTQSRPLLCDHGSGVPTTTLIPLPPKIGMGKPAITKRKFSPGRPRVKQVGSLGCHRSPLICFKFLSLLCFFYTSGPIIIILSECRPILGVPLAAVFSLQSITIAQLPADMFYLILYLSTYPPSNLWNPMWLDLL